MTLFKLTLSWIQMRTDRFVSVITDSFMATEFSSSLCYKIGLL